jgi:hypothetical protein
MADDQAFMYREDWLGQNGEPFCKVFCPVSATERLKRLTGNDKRQFVADTDEEEFRSNAMQISALWYRYDWDLHQMVAYMRRLDGATKTLTLQKRMDPMERMGVAKWRTDGSKTSFYGYWTFVAWDNVFTPILTKSFGASVAVMDEEDLDELLGATVMM